MASNDDCDKVDVVANLAQVQAGIDKAIAKHSARQNVTLVAVGKTKPSSMIQELYDSGHRHFGENYVQELVEKAETLPKDIKWHFIGHLQSNKAKDVAAIQNIHVVETVDSLKLAKQLQKQWTKHNRDHPLNIFVQVNTSGEESKSGVDPSAVVELVKKIVAEAPNLKIRGLMTIGAFIVNEDQPDFKCLARCREDVATAMQWNVDKLELSMGMSHDFQTAIGYGATNVRVGSTIFGQRNYAKKD